MFWLDLARSDGSTQAKRNLLQSNLLFCDLARWWLSLTSVKVSFGWCSWRGSNPDWVTACTVQSNIVLPQVKVEFFLANLKSSRANSFLSPIDRVLAPLLQHSSSGSSCFPSNSSRLDLWLGSLARVVSRFQLRHRFSRVQLVVSRHRLTEQAIEIRGSWLVYLTGFIENFRLTSSESGDTGIGAHWSQSLPSIWGIMETMFAFLFMQWVYLANSFL